MNLSLSSRLSFIAFACGQHNQPTPGGGKLSWPGWTRRIPDARLLQIRLVGPHGFPLQGGYAKVPDFVRLSDSQGRLMRRSIPDTRRRK